MPVVTPDLFLEVLDITADAVVILDEEQRILFFNPAAEALFGYREAEVVGRSVELLIPPRLQERYREASKTFRRSPERVRPMGTRQPVQGLRRDGTEFLADVSIARHEVEGGTFFSAVVRDRSEKERAEEVIRAGDTLQRSIVTAMAEGIVLQDAEGNILTCNASAERILGLSSAQIMGRTSSDPRWEAIREDGSPFPGEDHPAMVTLRTGLPLSQVVMGVHHPDGELIWISINSQPLFRRGEILPYAVVTSFADITGMRRAEKALRESNERYRSIFDNSRDAILLMDPQEGILAANAAACEIFRLSEEEIRRRGWAGVVDSIALPNLQESETSGRFLSEMRMRRGDGTVFPAEISSSNFRDRDGILRTSMIIRDITERMRLREELRNREESLELRVAERTRELAALLRLSHGLASTLSLQDLPPLILEGVRAFVEYDRGCLWISEGEEFQLLGSQPGQRSSSDARRALPAEVVLAVCRRENPPRPTVVESVGDESTIVHSLLGYEMPARSSGTGMIVPLVLKENITGCLALWHHQPGTFGAAELRLLQALADQAAVALENSRLYSQIHLAAAQAERSRLARELHDSVTQMLYSLALFAEAARQQMDQGGLERAGQHLLQIRETAQQALREMRLMVYELRPPALKKLGLVEALRQRVEAVERRAGVDVTLEGRDVGPVPASVEEELYRIAVEALNNALKHSSSTSVSLRIRPSAAGIGLEVSDNGRGMEGLGDGEAGGLGLTNMRERAERLGGTLDISSVSGEGTLVRAWVPLPQQEGRKAAGNG